MKTLDAPDFYGHTIFCDDIRHEAGNKTSYIGVYTGHLFIHDQFPLFLPKFGFSIHYIQRIRAYIPPTKFLIFLPGTSPDDPSTASIQIEASADTARKEELQALLEKSDHAVRTFAVQHIASPLLLEQPGTIWIRALRGEEGMVRLGSLTVGPPPKPDDKA